jgi:mono/diheme cytochrome c family protein
MLCLAAASVSAAAAPPTAAHTSDAPAVPPWLFPLNPPSEGREPAIDHNTPVTLSGSQRQFTEAQLNDLFYAPDWYPETHSPVPAIVLRGRAPKTFACVYCHSPSGQGRPENASLAGLPAAYIVQQVADMKSGARGSAWHGGRWCSSLQQLPRRALAGSGVDSAAGGALAHLSDAAVDGISDGRSSRCRSRADAGRRRQTVDRRHDRGGGVRGFPLAPRNQATLSAL